MNANEGISGKEFAIRAVVVAAAAVVVLLCVKIWIVDPLAGPAKEDRAVMNPAGAPVQEKSWDKTKAVIKWQDAASYLGRYVETEGEIVSSHNSGKVCYLNFDKNYKETLSLIIFASNFDRFPGSPEKYYLNKRIRIEGRIKDYKGRLEIVLGSKDQVKILQ